MESSTPLFIVVEGRFGTGKNGNQREPLLYAVIQPLEQVVPERS